MGKFLICMLFGLAAGAALVWWWLGGHPRTLAQPSDHLVGWSLVTRADSLASAGGATTWSVTTEVRLHNITAKTVRLTVPAQRFLVVLGDGSTVVGNLTEAASASIAAQQTTSVPLPVVSFFSRSKDVGSVLLALDEGDGLRLVAAPVGEEPAPKEQPKPEAKPEPKPEK